MRASGHITLRKRKRGDQWYANWRVRVEGAPVVRRKERIGPAWTEKGRPPEGYFTRRTAQAWLDAKLTDLRRGIGLEEGPKVQHTYGEACDEFLRWKESDPSCAFNTARGYRQVVELHLRPQFGDDTPLKAITTERIEEVKEDALAEGKLSQRSVQKMLVINYGLLKRAKRRKWIASNPAEDVERVTPKRSGDFNVLSPEEVLAVSRAAASEQDGALYTVAAFTGLRMGELRALRWQDIDFAGRNVWVRGNYTGSRRSTPKSGRVRSVPLIDQAAAALDRLSKRLHFTSPSDLVFPSDVGSYMDDGDVRQRFYMALDRAGLGHKRQEEPPLRFHDLRHSFGTLGARVWSLRDLQAYMGHASITTTEIYAHHIPKVAAADALGRLVSGELGGALDGAKQHGLDLR